MNSTLPPSAIRRLALQAVARPDFDDLDAGFMAVVR
jgi:hypothetical protein